MRQQILARARTLCGDETELCGVPHVNGGGDIRGSAAYRSLLEHHTDQIAQANRLSQLFHEED